VPGAVPVFEPDPSWPKPLPNHWVYGTDLGVGLDSRGHVWFLHGPSGSDGAVLAQAAAAQKGPAPPVLEFDGQGNVVQTWGGPGLGFSWPQAGSTKIAYPLVGMGGWAEHDLFVDYQDNVWVVGNGNVALKFTRTGKFILQLGELWKTGGSNDTKLLGNPTSGTVDPKTNEVYITDGYLNHRVIVFDAATGAYKRHWGAYGKRPDDHPIENFDPKGPPPQQFQPVHCVKIANDGLVYVCDRERNRIQVFRKDGTFVTEGFVAKDTPTTGPSGSVSDAAFSADPDQRYLYIGDHTNSKIWILRRSDLHVLGSFDSPGNHGIATDSKGNIYSSGPLNRAITPLGPRRYLFKGVSTIAKTP
jgi:DNA-binding beta-propeller fold protein YncE